jgi:hypothetical protein
LKSIRDTILQKNEATSPCTERSGIFRLFHFAGKRAEGM